MPSYEETVERRILRVFGVSGRDMALAVQKAAREGCAGLRLLSKDGEFALCFSGQGADHAQAVRELERWEAYFRGELGPAVYGAEGEGLPQATVRALLEKRRLLAAADAATGRLLTAALQNIPHSEAVFDFGNQSYRDGMVSPKMQAPAQLTARFPGDALQETAGRAEVTRQLSGADYVVAYTARQPGRSAFVLLATVRACWACPIPPHLTENGVLNFLLEIARRMALGAHPLPGTVMLRPGHAAPRLGEPALDLTVPSAEALREAPAENEAEERRPPRGRAPAAAEPAPEQARELPEALTAPGRETHAARALPEPPPQDEPVAEEPPLYENIRRLPRQPQPDVPKALSFDSLELEPPVLPHRETEDAGPWAGQEPPHSNTERQAALLDKAKLLYGGPEAEPPMQETEAAARQIRAASLSARQTDLLDKAKILYGGEEQPQPGRPNRLDEIADTVRIELEQAERDGGEAGREAAMEELRRRLDNLEIGDAHPPRRPGPTDRRVRESETRVESAGPGRLVGCIVAALLLAALAFAIVVMRGSLGRSPAPRSYGTAHFDQTAQAYLDKAKSRDSRVTAYLAWPGQDGMLLYAGGQPTQAKTGLLAAQAAELDGPGIDQALSEARQNTIIDCGQQPGIWEMAGLDSTRENAGFTLYTGDTIARYKVIGVYYWDKQEDSDTYFDLQAYQNLANYKTYLDFIVGVKMRSLFNFPVSIGEDDSFVSLVAPDGRGQALVVTGRRVRREEDANLTPSAIAANDVAVLPQAMYSGSGAPAPDMAELGAQWLDWYKTNEQEEKRAIQQQQQETGGDTGALVDNLEAATLALLSSTDELMAQLTDLREDGTSSTESEIKTSGEGSMPETTVSVDSIVAAAPPAQSGDSPEQGSENTEGGEQAPPAAAPDTPSVDTGNATSSEGETIRVTMNGAAQEMDLVECLAMVAYNELGVNAPDEAYKAQMVAAHCWILSQGGYPSVLGQTPTDHVRDLARQVAHVLVTYNGTVCFTPYFASASTGTASSASVWGGDRPYLQPVDSPYDQQYATHWRTVGTKSSTALFTREAVQQRVLELTGVDLNLIEDPNQWITILGANQYGWIGRGGIQLGQGENSTTCSGTWFRETLLCRQSVSNSSLRSSCFTVSYQTIGEGDQAQGYFVFDVLGYGHGCGMSQWGAVGYALNGWSYEQILTHYFTGVTLVTY